MGIFLRPKTETAKIESSDRGIVNINAEPETDNLTEADSAFDKIAEPETDNLTEPDSAFDKISGYKQKYEDNDNSVFGYVDYSDVDHTVGDEEESNLYA